MIQMTKQDIEAHDLRKAAIHECGHACVTRHYGMGGSPALWRNDNENFTEEKLWLGTTSYGQSASTPLRLRRVAIAGFLAEDLNQFDSPIDCDESDLAESLKSSIGECFTDSDGWSKSDWEGAQGWTGVDLHAVYVILRRNWENLMEEVEMLIEVASKSGSAISNPQEEIQCESPEIGNGGQSGLLKGMGAPLLVIPSKTRLKLTVVDLWQKEQLLQELLETGSRIFMITHVTSSSASDEGGKIRHLNQDYRAIINKVNVFIAAVHDNQMEHFSTQSGNWRKSNKGHAYQKWMDAWDIQISPKELIRPGQDGGFKLPAWERLQDLPNEPAG